MPTVDIGAIEASASEIPVIADGFKGVQIAPGSTDGGDGGGLVTHRLHGVYAGAIWVAHLRNRA